MPGTPGPTRNRVTAMADLRDLFTTTVTAGSAGGLLYGATITTVALTASLARDPKRRADARATLTILLRRRPPSR